MSEKRSDCVVLLRVLHFLWLAMLESLQNAESVEFYVKSPVQVCHRVDLLKLRRFFLSHQ